MVTPRRKPAPATTAPAPSASRLAGVMVPSEAMHHFVTLYNRLLAPFSAHLEARYEISFNEFRMLMIIAKLGTTAAHELVEHTGINAMGVSRAINLLHRHGRVTLEVDPQNRRRKQVRMTAKGRALFARMQPINNRIAEYLFAALRPDEVMAFDHFVRVLLAQLEATDEQGRSHFSAITHSR